MKNLALRMAPPRAVKSHLHRKVLLAAAAAMILSINAGCCRCSFLWPGHYHHNPSFSQCCEGVKLWPGNRDPFHPGVLGGNKPLWGRGSHGAGGGGCPSCQSGGGFAGGPMRGHGYPGGGHAMGHPGMGHPGMGYPPPGYPGNVSPEGIPLQPAPNAMSAAQVAYPYYTNRGPRDFLMGYPPGTQPPSIGP